MSKLTVGVAKSAVYSGEGAEYCRWGSSRETAESVDDFKLGR